MKNALSTERPKFIWSEKYTPQTLSECILIPKIESLLRGYVEKGQIPNLIFTGKAGVGKTTVAKVLVNDLNLQCLFINGSKESGIDTLRTTIESFASSKSFDQRGKVVIIDEADFLNPVSTQPAMRSFIDKFQNNCRFIFTCNYKNKILGPLLSRFTTVEFSESVEDRNESLKALAKRVVKILKAENVEFEPKALLEIVKYYFPDIRKLLNELQSFAAANGKIDVGILSLSNLGGDLSEIFQMMKEKKYGELKKWVANNEKDTSKIFTQIYESCFKFLKPDSVPGSIIALAKYQYQSAFVPDQELNLLACFTEIMFDSEFI